jgi:hypothetical protein
MKGWRLFFYANEGNEPIHIHCRKGDKECKFWLDEDLYEARDAYLYNMNNKDLREIKKIIYQNFDDLVEAWRNFHGDGQ